MSQSVLDFMISSVPIIPADVPNANNRVYPKNVLEAAIEKLKNTKLMGTIGYPPEFGDVKSPAFEATDFAIDGDMVVCNVQVIDPKIVDMLESQKFVVRTSGTGQVDEHGVVSDYTLVGLSVIPADEDAWAKPPRVHL